MSTMARASEPEPASAPPAAARIADPDVLEDAGSRTFEDLFLAEYEAMVRVAYLVLGSQPESEDVVQDAFARVHLRWGRMTNPAGYLRRCVVNGAVDVMRRRKVARRSEHLRAVDSTELGADEMGDALAALPHRQRAALILRYHEGLRDHEIAEALGVRPSTARSLVHRGLARLREVIER